MHLKSPIQIRSSFHSPSVSLHIFKSKRIIRKNARTYRVDAIDIDIRRIHALRFASRRFTSLHVASHARTHHKRRSRIHHKINHITLNRIKPPVSPRQSIPRVSSRLGTHRNSKHFWYSAGCTSVTSRKCPRRGRTCIATIVSYCIVFYRVCGERTVASRRVASRRRRSAGTNRHGMPSRTPSTARTTIRMSNVDEIHVFHSSRIGVRVYKVRRTRVFGCMCLHVKYIMWSSQSSLRVCMYRLSE